MMFFRPTVRSNIKLFQVYIFLNRLEMWLPITVLFLLGKGLTLAQYAVLDVVWYVSTLVFEVPTGVLTDRYGKKKSLLIAVLFQSLALFTLAFANSFSLFFVSYAVWGFATSFETGTNDALIYDSLKQMGKEADYQKVTGRITTLIILASALGSIIAGYLGGINLALPIIATATIALLSCPLVLLFAEPQVADVRSPGHLSHVRASVYYVLRHRLVALLILYSAVMGAAVWGLYIFYQPLLRSFDVSVERIGLLYLCFKLCGAAGAHLSDALYKCVGWVSIYLIPLCFIVSVFCLGVFVTPWVTTFIFANFFIAGFYVPILNDLLNRNIPSGRRATIISLGSVVSCLLSSIVYPVLGRIADAVSLQATFKVLGLGTLLCMALILALLKGSGQGRDSSLSGRSA